MNSLKKIILEKLIITKDTKEKENILPEGLKNDPLNLPNNRLEFPFEIEIGMPGTHYITETIIAYKIVPSRYVTMFYFYTEDDLSMKKPPCVWVDEKMLIKIFDKGEKTMIDTTKYGERFIKLKK